MSASTSNLGPGFDVVGLAIDLELDLVARPAGAAGAVQLSLREGEAADWPGGDTDLVVRAFRRAHEALGGRGGVVLEARSQIPVGRGLGSSGAAIAAGLLLGEALAPRHAAREQLLGWAIELEGHPDNVAPALFGGCVLTLARADAAPRALQLQLCEDLGFAVAWPDARLETAFARSLLPAAVPHEQAVDSARSLALVLEGLRRGDPELLAVGNDEHLHVPYRLPHIPGGRAALAAAREAGAYLATISGSGTALFAIGTRASAGSLAAAMVAAFATAGAGGAAHAVTRVPAAPQVVAAD